MIEINKWSHHAYTTLIDGNDGEEQLAIIQSGGQDGKTVLTIIAPQVDGGLRVLLKKTVVVSPYRNATAYSDLLRVVLQRYVCGGVFPTEEQRTTEFAKIERIIQELVER